MSTPQCLSLFALEKAVLEKDASVASHLALCPSCQSIAEAIINDQKAFRISHPFEPFYEKLSKRKKSKWILRLRRTGMTKGWFSWRVFLPLGSIALLLFMLRIGGDDGIRLKGGPEIGFYILDHGESEKGKRMQNVHVGDQIRLYVHSDRYPYVMIYGIEEDGALNRYYPDRGESSFPVPVGKTQLFPDSIILDNSPNSELFVGVFSQRPLTAPVVEAKLLENFTELQKEGKSLKDWDAGRLEYPQSTFYLEKK